MKRKSIVQSRGTVTFPQHTGERVYMTPFFKRLGLPDELRRWQPTVDAMLEGVDTAGPIYLMVDQALVRVGNPHRRPGVHIDGYWIPALHAHGNFGGHGFGGGGGGHGFGGGSGGGSGRHGFGGGGGGGGGGGNEHVKITIVPPETPKPKEQDPRDIPSSLPDIMFADEGLILASSVIGCQAYDGIWQGDPGEGGDCSHIDLSGLSPVLMLPGQVYAGTVDMLHESLPLETDCLRTVVRLNVPGWSPAHV